MPNAMARSAAPKSESARLAASALGPVRRILAETARAKAVRVTVEGEAAPAEVALPREAVELLAAMLDGMATGRAMSVVPRQGRLPRTRQRRW